MAKYHLLTALSVKRHRVPGMYLDGLGLYLQVGSGNAKSWIFRYRSKGKLRDMGLGSAHAVSLVEARERAANCRATLRRGLDPLDERRRSERPDSEPTQAKTFEQCAADYIATHRPSWRNAKHVEQWLSTLQTYAYPTLKDVPISQVDRDLVLAVLRPIWNNKTETASRLRGRIERILDWSATLGLRERENPARWRGFLDNLLPRPSKISPEKHHPALPFGEAPAFVVRLSKLNTVASRAFEFCILTATRTTETLHMRWSEYDENTASWQVPSFRMKGGRDHRVPLSDAALSILQSMKEIQLSPFVFPGSRTDKPLSSMAFLMLLRRLGRDDITAHGFRSTFRDWAAECTDHPADVVEMALAHTISNKVEAAYRRGDLFEKRRKLMSDWATYLYSTTINRC